MVSPVSGDMLPAHCGNWVQWLPFSVGVKGIENCAVVEVSTHLFGHFVNSAEVVFDDSYLNAFG